MSDQPDQPVPGQPALSRRSALRGGAAAGIAGAAIVAGVGVPALASARRGLAVAGQQALAQPAVSPAPGSPSVLGSNSNYLMAASSGNALPDVTVTIDVTQDMVLQDVSTGDPGFSFQLNCASPAGSRTGAQQYGFEALGEPGSAGLVNVSPSTILGGFVNNWTDVNNDDANDDFWMASAANTETMIPAGTQLTVSLQGDGLFRGTWFATASGGWASGGLLLYDRGAGVGAFYTVSQAGTLTKISEHDDWRASWNLVVTGNWAANNTGLLLYDRAAGTGSFFSVNSTGTLTTLATYTNWRTSWDLAVSGNWASGGAPAVLLYDRAAGTGEFHSVTSSGGFALMASHTNWLKSWTLGVYGGWGTSGQSGLLLYNQSAGTGAFFSVSSSGTLTTMQNYTTWRTTWDIIIAGGWAAPGHTGLFFYDRSANFGAFYSVDATGVMTLLSQTTFTNNSWTLAQAGNWAATGSGGLMLYDAAAGAGAFYSVSSSGAMTLISKYDNSITKATYSISYQGTAVTTATRTLQGEGLPASEINPILECQMNIVGPYNGEGARLSQGAGTITYSSSVPLTPTTGVSGTAFGFMTAETANTTYGTLPAGSSTTFTQSFAVTPNAPPPTTNAVSPGVMVRPVPSSPPQSSTTF